MAFRGCRFCGGRGCLACESERQKAIERAQEPIFVADANNPRDMELLKRVFSAKALEHAFGPDGEGVAEIEREAAIASFLQAVHFVEDATQQGMKPTPEAASASDPAED